MIVAVFCCLWFMFPLVVVLLSLFVLFSIVIFAMHVGAFVVSVMVCVCLSMVFMFPWYPFPRGGLFLIVSKFNILGTSVFSARFGVVCVGFIV
ncbi:hypothetical protein FKM82_018805 [Ascaphus truei]